MRPPHPYNRLPDLAGGLCLDPRIDKDLWHQDGKRAEEYALSICARCPVRTACLEDALEFERVWGSFGVWGNTTEEQRAELLKRGAA